MFVKGLRKGVPLSKDSEAQLEHDAARDDGSLATHFRPIRVRDGASASAPVLSGRRGGPGLDIRLVEAKLKLGKLYPEDMPQLACDALESGYDGPNLGEVALLHKPTSSEIDPLLPGLKAELRLAEIDNRTASLRLAQSLAREILSRRLAPIPRLVQLAHLWRDGGYPIELSGLGQLEDELDYSAALPRPGFVEDVTAELRKLAELTFE